MVRRTEEKTGDLPRKGPPKHTAMRAKRRRSSLCLVLPENVISLLSTSWLGARISSLGTRAVTLLKYRDVSRVVSGTAREHRGRYLEGITNLEGRLYLRSLSGNGLR